MTANLRRKVLKRAHEDAQKLAEKSAQTLAKKSAQNLARQRKLEDLLARAEKAKREIAYYNTNLQKEEKEETVVDLREARKNLAIENWYKRHRVLENADSNNFVSEEPKKKKAKMSDESECRELLTLRDEQDSNGIILIF